GGEGAVVRAARRFHVRSWHFSAAPSCHFAPATDPPLQPHHQRVAIDMRRTSRRRDGMLARRVRSRVVSSMVALLTGCSVSVSSWSLSKSVRSSSRSSDSSSSSSPGAAERAYRDDVSDYTQAYVKSSGGGGDLGNFRADLARLAEEHGITNWEENPSTYTAIGEGLAKAGVSSAARMAYKQNLSGGDASKAQLIQQGYDSGR